jgi:hypothetical protein
MTIGSWFWRKTLGRNRTSTTRLDGGSSQSAGFTTSKGRFGARITEGWRQTRSGVRTNFLRTTQRMPGGGQKRTFKTLNPKVKAPKIPKFKSPKMGRVKAPKIPKGFRTKKWRV